MLVKKAVLFNITQSRNFISRKAVGTKIQAASKSCAEQSLFKSNYFFNEKSGIIVAIRKYFSDCTAVEKEKAFVIIDKYLAQMAREEVKKGKYSTYEDCFQDLRLRFIELANSRNNEKYTNPKNFLRALKYKKSVKQENVQMINLEGTANQPREFAYSDTGIINFELRDYLNYLLENNVVYRYGIVSKRLYSERECNLLRKYLIDEEEKNYAAAELRIPLNRISTVLFCALRKMKSKSEFAPKDMSLQNRTNQVNEIVNELIKQDEAKM